MQGGFGGNGLLTVDEFIDGIAWPPHSFSEFLLRDAALLYFFGEVLFRGNIHIGIILAPSCQDSLLL